MKTKLIIILIIFNFQFLILNCGFAQQAGTPYITNFPPDVYKANSQNWAIVQDKRGVLFFGNTDGVLEYDGITWRLIKTPSAARSLAIDSTGRIYVGIRSDFGYLHTDSSGVYQYQSLKEKIPKEHREFNDVWKIFVSGNRIFFPSEEKVFVLQNDSFKVIYPEERFHVSFLVNQTYYVRERGKGLMIYKNDTLQPAAGGEQFANEKIYAMLPYRENEILIATRTQGVVIYSDKQNKSVLKPAGFEAVDKFLLQHPVFCGTVSGNGHFALGTLTGGIIVFNTEGEIQTIYHTDSGLQDNVILRLFYDNNQQLWAALGNGISLIQSNLPFQLFTEKQGLEGSPLCIEYFNNRLYVGTSQYLCVQNADGNFETIAGTEGQNWQLCKTNNQALLAHNNGLFEIKEKQAIPIIKSTGFLNLCPLNNKPDYLLAGLTGGKGICLLEYHQKTWKIKHRIKGFAKSAYTIIQDNEENIWVFSNPELYQLKLNETMDSAVSVKQYTTKQGLPTNSADPYLLNSGKGVFGTEKGIYRYNSAAGRFEQHPDFTMLTGDIYPFQQQKNGDIWFQENFGNGVYEKGVLKYNTGKYQLIKQAFYKFNDLIMNNSHNFYVTPDSTVYIGTNKGLLEYNPKQIVDYNISFHTLIRKVFAKDSLLYGGAPQATLPKLEYQENNLVFHYAAAFYEDAEKNLYSYRLIGSDTTWSAWVSDVKKEYTNLSEGNYRFEVKSKNQYKAIGTTAAYSFRILPPWYRTWWAYTIYVILIILVILVIVKLFTRRLVKQKEHLEQVVKERTAKVVQQKEEIQATLETVNKQKTEIETQKTEIEYAHKNITDSINYASRIQAAVLPSHKIIEESLPEHFILFKPRDVVSGDFYWIQKINNYLMIAAADCTGHGVPGAFMSMLGISFLNEIVRKKDVSQANHVLEELRNSVKETLNQTGKTDESKDGMDMAFYVIDTDTNILQFSGANNPLYIFRNKELLEYKATRQPIGIYAKEKPFANHEIQLESGDSLYTFSDGYVDQSGGQKGRKFLSKQFKETLMSIQNKNMEEQKQILEQTFENWRGDIEQIDDVLVVGVKI